MTRNQIKKVKNWRRWLTDKFCTIVCEEWEATDGDVVNLAAETAYLLNLNAGAVVFTFQKVVRDASNLMEAFRKANKRIMPAELYEELLSDFMGYVYKDAAARMVKELEELIKERRDNRWETFGSDDWKWYLKRWNNKD